MELSYGKNITLDKAQQLGVLEAAEALVREDTDQPWEAVVPADVPMIQDGGGEDKGTQAGQEPSMVEQKHSVSLHRALRHLHKGGLHRALKVPEGEPIPAEKLESAKNSTNQHVRRMAQFASVLEGFHH